MGINRAADISKDLLAYAHPRSENFSTVNLAEVANAAIRLLSHKHHHYKIILECDDFIQMQGQKIKLEELLINLLSNAIDASQPGSRILLEISTSVSVINILVQDNGHGMTAETLNRAQELFFSTKPIGKGTGLGLAISAAIVRAHHGEMELKSQIGQGTQVNIRFGLDGAHND